jgi:non-specific serine/threonine protein kinase
MLDTIRAYARAQLVASGEDVALQRAHADYYLALADTSTSGMTDREHTAWLGRLEHEYPNLRAALRWLITHDPAAGARLTVILGNFWHLQGFFRDGHTWLEQILEERMPIPAAMRANLFQAAGFLTVLLPHNHARAYFTRGFELYHEADDRLGVGWALNGLGFDALVRGDHQHAGKWFAESLAIAQDLHDQELTAQVSTNLGYLACAEGNDEHARQCTEEGLRFARVVKNYRWMVFALNNLVMVALKQHKYAEAKHHLQETVRVLDELRDQPAIADVLAYIALLTHAEGDAEQTARFLAACDALREPLEGKLAVGPEIERENMLAALRTHLDAERFAAAWAAGRAMTLDEALIAAQTMVLSGPMDGTAQSQPLSEDAIGGTRVAPKQPDRQSMPRATDAAPASTTSRLQHQYDA